MSPLAAPSPAMGGAGAAQHPQASSSSQTQPQPPLARVDTHDLKSKLALALGNNGRRYWQAFVSFCTANISRDEFEEEASACLKAQHVHLHNALVFGILYNATSGVPGPSSVRHHPGLRSSGRRDEYGELVDPDEDDEDPYDLFSPRKRLRTLVAGLSKKERKRLKGLAKAPGQRGAGGSAGGNLGWAGAGADMLEKKRKDEERRRTAEEKRRFREAYTEIGKPDWREGALRDLGAMRASYEMAPASVQRSIAKALTLPMCAEAKHLPDADSLRDLMTLQAVEAGLPQGAHPQAAALLLAALQDHLQNIASSVIAKVRSNRQNGIRTNGPDLPASIWPPATHEDWTAAKGDASADARNAAAQGDDMDVDAAEGGEGGGADVSMDSPAIRLQNLGDESHGSVGEASADATDLLRPNPARKLRNVASDLSARTATSALASSLADTSAVSFVSTAPTSIHGGGAGSEDSSRATDKGDSSMHSSNAADDSMDSVRQGKRRQADDSDGEEDEGEDERAGPSHPTESTPSRLLRDATLARASAARAKAQRSIALDDLGFLLDVAPHTVVEPLGQAPQERFMTPPFERLGLSGLSDDDDDGDKDADAEVKEEVDEEEEDLAFRRDIRRLAYRKIPTPPPSVMPPPQQQPGLPPPPQAGGPRPSIAGALAEQNVNLTPHRARRLLDQSAPLKLLDRRSLVEEGAKARAGSRPTKGGLSIGGGTQPQAQPQEQKQESTAAAATGPFAGPAGADAKARASSKGPSAFMPSSSSSASGQPHGESSVAGGEADNGATTLPNLRKLSDSLWDVVDLHDFFGPNV